MPSSIAMSLNVVTVGVLWGLYWMPLRQVDSVAAAGPWITLAGTLVAVVVLAPVAWRRRPELAHESSMGIGSVLLGGASFVLYSNGLLYGQVAVVILMFYLTPVWSTLIARLWLAQPIPWWRYASLVLGFVGIALVLRGSGSDNALPVPHRLGDWLGLGSGIGWAIASTGMNRHSRSGPAATNFIFCIGAALAAAAMAVGLGWDQPPRVQPGGHAQAVIWTLLIGAFWWAASLILLMRAAQVLEPARVGILLLSEVLCGTVSAALFADEPFGLLIAGGAVLVIAAGVFESAPGRRGHA